MVGWAKKFGRWTEVMRVAMIGFGALFSLSSAWDVQAELVQKRESVSVKSNLELEIW